MTEGKAGNRSKHSSIGTYTLVPRRWNCAGSGAVTAKSY